MKIVVYRVGHNSWRWVIRDGSKANNNMAVGLRWYTRKSDAKRGAARFEQKLFESFVDVDVYGNTNQGEGLPIEVIE